MNNFQLPLFMNLMTVKKKGQNLNISLLPDTKKYI